MVKAPNTYSEWMECLDIYKKEEKIAIDAMKQGTIIWQSGVAERFSKSVLDVVEYKINQVFHNFKKNQYYKAYTDFEIENSLLYARREFNRLLELSELEAFSDELRIQIEKYINESADSMQKSLLESVKNYKSDRIEKLIRKNPVNRLKNREKKQEINSEESNEKINFKAKRRILI